MNNKPVHEIYVYNAETITEGVYAGSEPGTVSGWEIKFVRTDKDIKTYPLFDCVITTNDSFHGELIEDF